MAIFVVYCLPTLDSHAKSSPTYKNPYVYRWQILRLRLHDCWSLKLKDNPSVKISKFTGGKFFVYCLRACLILKLQEDPSVNVSKFTGGNFFVYRLQKCWILKLK